MITAGTQATLYGRRVYVVNVSGEGWALVHELESPRRGVRRWVLTAQLAVAS